jgi:heat shock protein HslJ
MRKPFVTLLRAALPAAFAFALLAGAASAAPGVPDQVVGQEWRLVSYQGADGQTTDTTALGITIEVAADGTVSGFGGCNRYRGTFQVAADGTITPGPIASTKVACADANKTQWETRYFAALQSVSQYRVSGAQVQLLFDKGAGILTFAPAAPGAGQPAALAGLWTLVSYQGADGQTADVRANDITIRFAADGTVSGSGGCNVYGGTYTADAAGTLTLSQVIATLRACLDQNKTDWETRYFAALQTVSAYKLTGDQLHLDFAGGSGMLTFTRGQAAPGGPLPGMPVTGGGPAPLWLAALGALFFVLGGLALRRLAVWPASPPAPPRTGKGSH